MQAIDLERNVVLQGCNRIEISGKTDIGRKRTLNEDNFGVSADLGLAVVADGMGGHEAGEIASKLAVDEIQACMTRHTETLSDIDRTVDMVADFRQGEPETTTVMREAMSSACAKIYALNQERGHADGKGMGTTAVAVLVDGASESFTFANVGDSRLYRYRSGALEQLTADHTAFQHWLDTGRKGPSPRKNVILRALGPWRSTEVDIGVRNLLSGDVLLLCSDGLHGLVANEVIRQVLASMDSLNAGCDTLVELANSQGGKDNISVILIRYN